MFWARTEMRMPRLCPIRAYFKQIVPGKSPRADGFDRPPFESRVTQSAFGSIPSRISHRTLGDIPSPQTRLVDRPKDAAL
jgi:hypothetical protein